MKHRTTAQFIRAQFSSLSATGVDYAVTAILFQFCSVGYVWSALLGAMCGGLFNGIVNYEWTFRGTDRSRRGVALRYIVVWGGSILLNAWGVKLAVALLSDNASVSLPLFMTLRIIIAILVAVLWNFNLQKHWVYRRYGRRFK
jgi:putative flippase GtrA